MRNIHVEYDPSNGYVLVQVEIPYQAWPTVTLSTEEAEHLRDRLNLWHTQRAAAFRARVREAQLTETVPLPDGPKAIITHLIEDHDINSWSIPGSLAAQHEHHDALHVRPRKPINHTHPEVAHGDA